MLISKRFIRFCLVGVVATVGNYTTFYILFSIFGIFYMFSSGAGYLIGVATGFLLNRHYTFGKRTSIKSNEILRYASVYVFSLLVGLSFLIFQVEFLEIFELLANVFTIGLTTILNYIGASLFVFSKKKKVGLALYLDESEDIKEIYKKVGESPDFIHLDLVDESYKKDSADVDIEKGTTVRELWPEKQIMTHIMSRRPSDWIPSASDFSDYILIHLDIDEDIEKVLDSIRCKKGIVVTPKTDLEIIRKYRRKVDIIQVLGVEKPGISGQGLLGSAKMMIEDLHWMTVCLDGGVKIDNSSNIDTKSIVSRNTILNSPSPRDTIHHMKKGESTSDLSKAERLHYMIKIIINTLEKIPGLVSGNIVGSTADKNTKRYPGDIDVVIIVKKLDKRTFHDIISLFRSREELFRDYTGIRLNINTLFGPIKFHKGGAITIHLMIYDLNAHIEHVLKSPFTCLDWEKTRIFVGKHIRDVFQTPDLMPRDFIDSRRSIHEHTKALSEGKITYREYQFDNEGLAEQRTHKKEMNGQDKFEYSYHIMLFTMLNFLKLYDAENVNLPEKEIMTRYFSIIDANRHKYIKFFRRLKNMKKSGKFSVWKDRYVQIVRQFFEDFQAEYDEIFGMSAKKIILLRHIETPSNDEDVFIGQRQDPSIKKLGYEKHRQVSENLNEFEFTNVHSSPMTRCKQTLQALGFESYEVIDDLKEIDYGEAEGKTLDDLHKEFPEIIDGWRHGDDPAFPSGENTDDVKTRAFRCLHNINKEKGDTLICTHNVPIRTIVGSLLGLPMHDWYLLNIPFAEPIELLIAKNGKYYLNLSLNMKEVLFENLKRKTIRNCIGTGEATIRRDKQM